MAKLEDGGTINHVEQRAVQRNSANYQLSGKKLKITVNVTRQDQNKKIAISKKSLNSKITRLARKTTAKLSWS